ncbi:MAG TPA: tetratricopeptide repeat protein [Chthonomonadales bacterium]|nr:tetratricopeptide repeat protein [Chthonomonadales bacterium]
MEPETLLMDEARAAAAAGDLAAAQACLEQIVERHPDNAEARRLLAHVLLQGEQLARKQKRPCLHIRKPEWLTIQSIYEARALIGGALLCLLALYSAISALRICLRVGFNAERWVTTPFASYGPISGPAHLMFAYPVLEFLAGVALIRSYFKQDTDSL